MDVIHKVFVSSTYTDLREERAAVERTLLQLKCFPVGMEIFPASDDTAWEFIKSQIDDSDYYVLIIAARYGSVDPTTGKSYTEMEYDYALEKGVPILSFLHSDPGAIHDEKRDSNPDLREKLDGFRKKVQRKLCRSWQSTKELQHELSVTLMHAKDRHKREGFVRAALAVDHKKMLELREANEALKRDLALFETQQASSDYFHKRRFAQITIILMGYGEEGKQKLDEAKIAYLSAHESDRKVVLMNIEIKTVFQECGFSLLNGCSRFDLSNKFEAAALSQMELNGANLKGIPHGEVKLDDHSVSLLEIAIRASGLVAVRERERVSLRGEKRKHDEYYLTQLGVTEFSKLNGHLDIH